MRLIFIAIKNLPFSLAHANLDFLVVHTLRGILITSLLGNCIFPLYDALKPTPFGVFVCIKCHNSEI